MKVIDETQKCKICKRNIKKFWKKPWIRDTKDNSITCDKCADTGEENGYDMSVKELINMSKEGSHKNLGES